MTRGYEPKWDEDLKRGAEGEARFREVAGAIGNGKVEVKRDDKALQTGNLYIEIYQWRKSEGYNTRKNSGILITEADWWSYILGPSTLLLPTALLGEVVAEYFDEDGNLRDHPDILSQSVQSQCSQGIVIPIFQLILRINQYSEMQDVWEGQRIE